MFPIPQSYYDITMGRESGGNPNAKNPRSSASGSYQFIDSTYLNYARQMFPGQDDQSLLSRKNDPALQQQIMESFTKDNAQMLGERGHSVTPGTLYLAHFLGGGGAHKALSSKDDDSVEAILGSGVVNANPHLRGMTIGALKQWADSKYNKAGTGAPAADLPAPGATEAQFRPPPGIGSDFLEGGPGAFFGRPQEGWNAGDTLTRVGAAMMARDNPQGAAVIMKGLDEDDTLKKLKLAQAAREKYKQHFDPVTGKIVTMTDDGRQISTVETGGRPDKPKAFSPAAVKIIEGNKDAAETSYRVLEKMNKYREMFISGDLDVSVLSRLDKNYRQLLNDSDAKTRNAANFLADMEDMRNARLLEAKGVQTEGDANRAMSAIVPGLSGYDNKTMLSLLDRASGDLHKAYEHHSGKYNQVVGGVYKDYDPDGLTVEENKGRSKRQTDFEGGYSKRRDEFMARGSVPTTAPGTTAPGAGSLRDRILEDFRKQ